jgi:hypothetical protein
MQPNANSGFTAVANARASVATIEVDISKLRNDYKIISEAGTTLVSAISQIMVS